MIRQICSIKPDDVTTVRSSELLAKLELAVWSRIVFYPEFGVPVRSSEKGPGQTLVRSLGSEFGERIWPNPGSAGSEF